MKSILDLPRLGADPAAPFPPVSAALDAPNGLLAWGGDLHPQRLLAAYRAGIFPWYSEGQPVLWWSPAPRCVIFPAEVHLSRRTRRRYSSGRYRLTADQAFDRVLAACAEPRGRDGRQDHGTWITPAMQDAYGRLHRLGHAHSIEVWQDDALCGGIYGLAIGRLFCGESMFAKVSDASKVAFAVLVERLREWGYDFIDCQVPTDHLKSLGAKEVSRDYFLERLGMFQNEKLSIDAWKNC